LINFLVKQEDHKNCRISLLVVVVVCRLEQNQKIGDDDDCAVHKPCGQNSQSTDYLIASIQVQILLTCPMRNRIRLQTFAISHFRQL